MTGDEAFPQGFLQRFDRVSPRQRAEQRGLRMAALVGASRAMATRAFLGQKSLSALEGGGVLGARGRNGESHRKPAYQEPHTDPHTPYIQPEDDDIISRWRKCRSPFPAIAAARALSKSCSPG